jgi:pimeloyl-ACP methyl ester carboxylesterase
MELAPRRGCNGPRGAERHRVNARLALAVLLQLCACRAASIPAAARYPAGTPFVARFLRVDGTNLRYIDAGHGTPVIFLHGFGASIYAWRYTLAPVESAGFRVLAFDNRGFGSSEKPAQGYSNESYVHLLIAFMDSLQLPDAVLVGHGMGGAIVAQCAITNPGRVRGMVLIDAAGFGIRAPKALAIASVPGVASVGSRLRSRWLTARLLRSTYADPRKLRSDDIDQYYAPVAEPDFGRALRGALREFRFDALVGRLTNVQAPALVVWGERDEWIPPRLGRALASDLPRVAYLSVRNAGYALPEEAPAEVSPLLLAFLRDGVPAPPSNVAVISPWQAEGIK